MRTPDFTLHLLLHSATLVEAQLRRRLTDLGVRPRQARVVDALERMGSASQADLAREMDVTPASMSTMAARLAEAGFVTRNPDPAEARSNVLSLTPHGRSLLSDILEAWADIDQLIVEAIGADKAADLAAATRALRDALGGHVPGTGLTGNRPGITEHAS